MSIQFPNQSDYIVTKIGAVIAMFSGASAWLIENAQLISTVCGIIGVFIGVAGFVFQRRRDQREKNIYSKRMALLDKQIRG